MRAISTFATALALSATVFACAATTDDPTTDPTNNGEESTEQDLTGRQEIGGDWKNNDGSLDAFDFKSDGTFIHDQFRVLNGVLVHPNGGSAPPFGRDSGKYSVSQKHGTVTLHITDGWHAGSTQVYAYKYTAAKVLNGVFLPGHEPAASLDLTLQPAPNERLAAPNPTKHYRHVSSFCAAVGASCVGLAPNSCSGGTVLDANNFSCGGGLGVECCQK
jgi:hypothetical protein